MEHRKDKHISTVAFCRNKKEGECIYSDETCWWKHSEQGKEEPNKCYMCEKTFVNRGRLMLHKKVKHEATVRTCNYFDNGVCRFREESCWYKHKQNRDDEDDKSNMEVDETNSSSVFQEAQEILKPPIRSQN